MDRLTEQQRTPIGKMSDESLRAKLVEAGYQEEVAGQLDRQTMMVTLATYMADEEECTIAAVEVQERAEDENLDDSTDTQTQAGAMSLEERRLFLEERRFQMEEQRWKAELLSKEQCLRDELLSKEKMEEQRLRLEMEFKERQRQDELMERQTG